MILKQKARNFLVQTLHPGLRQLLRGETSESLDETYLTKTRCMGLLHGENCIILTV